MILMKDIVREGHPTLRQVAEPVQLPVSLEDKQTLKAMMEYIKNSIDDVIGPSCGLRPSVGLAAPQINVPKRMIAVHTTDENDEKLYSYMVINPRIISHSEELTYLSSGEGCLSIDRPVEGYVMRYKRITVEGYFLNENDEVEKKTIRLKGYPAIVFQHEIDHLNGILFPDHINPNNPFYVPEGAKPIIFK